MSVLTGHPALLSSYKHRPDLSDKEKEHLAFAIEFRDKALEARRPYEPQWYINMAMTLRHQWLRWNSAGRYLFLPTLPKGRQRVTCNKIQGIVLSAVSILGAHNSVQRVQPRTTRDEDLHRARLSQKVLSDIHRRSKMDLKNLKYLMWMVIYGTAFKDFFMDYSKGQRVRKLKGVNEAGEMTFYDFRTGEVNCRVLSPFSVLPESGATDLDESSQRIMISHCMSVERVRQHWPKMGAYVDPEHSLAISPMEQQLRSLIGRQYGIDSPTPTPTKSGYVSVYELRELPSQEYPQGRHLWFANEVLLGAMTLPYQFQIRDRHLALVKYDYIKIGECFWGRTPITDGIPIQVALNQTLSQIEEAKAMTAQPKWIFYKEHHLPESAGTNEPGEVLEPTYYPGAPDPHPVQPPDMPVYVREWPGVLQSALEDSTLIHQVTMGRKAPGTRSGVDTNYLQEADLAVFAPVAKLISAKESEAGTIMLEIAKEKYRETRLLEVIGPDGEMEVQEFKADATMPTKVYVEPGTSGPEPLVARRLMVKELAAEGLLGDPNDPHVRRHILKLMEFGQLEKIFEEETADERESEREHRLWVRGDFGPVHVNEFDNDQVHILRHDLFRKSERYRELVAKLPPEPGAQAALLEEARTAMITSGGQDENEIAEEMLEGMSTGEQLVVLGAEGVIDRHVRTHMEQDPDHQAMRQEQEINSILREKLLLENELIKAEIEQARAKPMIDAALVKGKGDQVAGNIERDRARVEIEALEAETKAEAEGIKAAATLITATKPEPKPAPAKPKAGAKK